MRWISNIHSAWARFYPLNHETAGPPGRGSEEALFNLCNTNKSRRHVYFKNGTIGFASNYHKGHLSGGMYKYVLRLLPYDLAVIFMILIRIVRPIELLVLTEFFVERKNINKIVDIYQTKVYASWGHAWTSENLSAALADWFKKHFGFAVGIRLYRHIAISIGRRYLDYTRETNPFNNALAKMAGHTPNTEQKDYAVEKGSTGNYQADEMYYAKISRDWHAMFGLRTTK